jgi:hypothetical protein
MFEAKERFWLKKQPQMFDYRIEIASDMILLLLIYDNLKWKKLSGKIKQIEEFLKGGKRKSVGLVFALWW